MNSSVLFTADEEFDDEDWNFLIWTLHFPLGKYNSIILIHSLYTTALALFNLHRFYLFIIPFISICAKQPKY